MERKKPLAEKNTRYWDEVARSWQEATPRTFWRAYNDAINTSIFAQWLQADGVKHLLKTDLFDESLGDGLHRLLATRAKFVFGIDLSLLTVRVAKLRHYGLKVTGADVRHLPFADGVFDVIVSNSTLDHFESSDEIISSFQELYRVLRVGGHLLLTLDNLTNPVISIRNLLPFSLLKRLNIVPYYIGSTFGPKNLCHYLKQTGFEVLEVKAVMHFPRILTMLLAQMLERLVSQRIQKGVLHFLMSFEHMSLLPTRFLTGHYIAVRTIKK